MSAHTPGPWRTYRDSHVAVVSGTDEEDTFRYVAQDMSEADARLIAAAPELLKALDELTLAVEFRIDDPRSRLRDAARAAITKARSGR